MGSISLTQDQTQDACVGSTESQPLDHQGSPVNAILEVPRAPFKKAAFFFFLKKRKAILGLFFLPVFLPLSLSTQTQVGSTHTCTRTRSFLHGRAGLGHPPGFLPALVSHLLQSLGCFGGTSMSPFRYKVENRKVGQDRGCAADPSGTLPSHLCALGPIDPFLKVIENLHCSCLKPFMPLRNTGKIRTLGIVQEI